MGQYKEPSSLDISAYIGDLKIGIASTYWNEAIVSNLLEGAKSTLKAYGLDSSQIVYAQVPGAFELPLAAKLLMEHNKLDAVICLGCVIKGETTHDEYINKSVASALMQLGLMADKPVVYGVLTTLNEAQAIERSGGKKGHKGHEAAVTALQMIDLKKKLSVSKKKIGY